MKIDEIALQQVLRTYGTSLRAGGNREKPSNAGYPNEIKSAITQKKIGADEINYDIRARINFSKNEYGEKIDFLD